MKRPLNIEHAFERMCFIDISYRSYTHAHRTLRFINSKRKQKKKTDSLRIYCSDDNNKFQKKTDIPQSFTVDAKLRFILRCRQQAAQRT